MKFTVTIRDNYRSYSETYDEGYLKKEYEEDIHSDNFRNVKTNINDIDNFNGTHFIFGWLEGLSQSDDCPPFLREPDGEVFIETTRV